jgi:hypothetical protein
MKPTIKTMMIPKKIKKPSQDHHDMKTLNIPAFFNHSMTVRVLAASAILSGITASLHGAAAIYEPFNFVSPDTTLNDRNHRTAPPHQTRPHGGSIAGLKNLAAICCGRLLKEPLGRIGGAGK